MKVGILTTSFPAYQGDSQSPFIFNLAKGLVQNKVNVLVICPNYKLSKEDNEDFGGIKIERFNYFIRKFQTLTDNGSIPDSAKAFYGKLQVPFFCLFYLIKGLKVARNSDVIHAQWIIPSGFIGVILKKVYNKPLIATTRGSEIAISAKSRFWRFFLNYTLKNCNYVTSNNRKHLESFRQLGVPDEKLFYMPNGLDYELFKKRDKLAAREKLNLPLNDRLLLFVGHLIPVKRVELLIVALAELSIKYPNLKLVIVGDGPLKSKLVNLTNELNLGLRVYFIGNVKPQEVSVYMNASDIFVLSSSSEGRPNVVLEAMASQLPVVSTRVGDLSSFIVNGKAGFIVDRDNFKDLHKKIDLLLSNVELRRKFSLNAFKTVKKTNPSIKKAAAGYLSIYNKLLKNER